MKSKEKEKHEKKEVINKINNQAKEENKKEESKKENQKKEEKKNTEKPKTENKENNKDEASKIESSNPLNKKKEELKGPVENKPTSISTYNGDKCEDYNWSQGVGDVTIQFTLKQKINKKMLKIDMTVNHLKIVIDGMDKPLIDDDFCEKIIPDDSNWTIEDGQSIILFLEKATEIIWKSAFKGGKEIDTKTVDNSKRIDEFDSETQAALNKIVYEQNRKRNGLPTTEEEKKLEALKEAWNKPGSPFAGQPFDPSMFNLNEPIYMNTPDYEARQKAKQNKEKK
jgi:hypothetical protein